jgi:hypothetical protein
MPAQILEPRDYRLMVRNALHNLELAKQVLQQGATLFEQQVALAEQQTNKSNDKIHAPSDELARDGVDADEEPAKLRELHARPPSAKFTTEEVALYLNCSTSLLRTWRWQGRGPAFEGTGRMVRYTKGKLDDFMTA